MSKWGLDMRNPQQSWRELDNFGIGKVFFADFVQWAIVRTLQLDDNGTAENNAIAERDGRYSVERYASE